MIRLGDTPGQDPQGPLRRREIDAITPVLAGFVAVACIVSLVGVVIGRSWLEGMGEFSAEIRASVVVAALSLALALLGVRKVIPIPRVVHGLLLLLAVAAAATSLERWIPELRRTSALVLPDGTQPYEMASLPAIAVVLLAVGVYGLRHRGAWIAISDACASGALAIVAFIAYSVVVGTPGVTYVTGEPPPLIAGVVLILLLAVALLTADVDRDGVVAVLARDGVGGKAARSFALVALAVPVGLEMLRAWLVRGDVIGRPVGATLSVAVTTMLLVVLVIVGARRLDRYEQALRRAREAGFMSVLSHELRSPLIAMRNLGEVADDGWDQLADEQKRLVLRTTSQEANRMLRMVHDAAQRSKLDAGRLQARPAAVVLRDSLLDAGKSLGREVVVHCPERITAFVDPEHLRLILDACVAQGAQDSSDADVKISAVVRGEDAVVYLDLTRPLAPEHRSDAADRRIDRRRIGDLRTVAALARLSGGEARYERRDTDTGRYVLTFPLAVDPGTEFRA